MIDVIPVKFEAYDDMNDGVFQVEAFDEAAATVTISTVVTVALWDEIAPLIRQCLLDMKLEGDKTE